MKVFVAGAGGVIGRRLVPMLVSAGHQVTGMTRHDARAAEIEAAGATSAICDVFDLDRLKRTVQDASPDAVIHELTDLPQALDPRKAESHYAGNDRVRSEGTRNLVGAALAAGVRRMVAQSISFAYEPSGPTIKTERDPLFDAAPPPWSRSVAALHALEDAVTKAEGLEGIVLRYGFFYGPGSAYAPDGHLGRETQRRRMPLIGKADGVFSFIHVDDAALATIRALDHGTPGGIYNIVDDDPAAVGEWLPAFAVAVGAKPPRRVPRWLARLVAGRFGVMLMTEMRGASNELAKRELDWAPQFSSWRQGFAQGLS